jgi:hypothetical protein
MLCVRFYTSAPDWRPVNWPIKHPYWCTGYAGDLSYSVIVAYADDLEYITTNWPEATEIEATEVDDYKFSERFPRPEWL